MILQMLTERTGGHGLIPDATNVSVLIDVHLHDLAEARGDKLACRNRRNHLGRLRVVDVRLRPSAQSQPAGACLQCKRFRKSVAWVGSCGSGHTCMRIRYGRSSSISFCSCLRSALLNLVCSI